MDKGKLLKGIRAVASYYGASSASIQKLINTGAIPSYRIGKGRYFYSGEIDEALREKKEASNEK